MKNMGLADWAWVSPEEIDLDVARRLAVHAEELLERVEIYASLDEAVADYAWVVGTTTRTSRGKRILSPQEVAREARERGPTALVFGNERSGLSNAEIERCHELSCIPAHASQPSLNLAQAALLYGWELRRAELTLSMNPPGQGTCGVAHRSFIGQGEVPEKSAASHREWCLLEEALRNVLRERGFLRGPERHAVRDLIATLRRARLSAREARRWIAAMKGRRQAPPVRDATNPNPGSQ